MHQDQIKSVMLEKKISDDGGRVFNQSRSNIFWDF